MQRFGILFTNTKNGRRFLMVENKESPTFYTVSDFEMKSGLAEHRVSPISKLNYFVLIYNGERLFE